MAKLVWYNIELCDENPDGSSATLYCMPDSKGVEPDFDDVKDACKPEQLQAANPDARRFSIGPDVSMLDEYGFHTHPNKLSIRAGWVRVQVSAG